MITVESNEDTDAVARQQQSNITNEQDHKERLIALARFRFVLAPVMGTLITVLMTVFVGYHAVFTIFLGVIVGIGILLVLPSMQKSIDRIL